VIGHLLQPVAMPSQHSNDPGVPVMTVMGPGLPVVHSHSVATPSLTLRSSKCEQSWADIWVPWSLHREFQIYTLIYSQPPRHHSYLQNHSNIFVLRKTGFQLRNLEVVLPLYAHDKANNDYGDHMPERSPANLVSTYPPVSTYSCFSTAPNFILTYIDGIMY